MDIKLILTGLFSRGALVQFDRRNFDRLDDYLHEHEAEFRDLAGVIEDLKREDAAYRRSLPDLTHHSFQILTDPGLRRSIRAGLIQGYREQGIVDAETFRRLKDSPGAFGIFYLLGASPLLGTLLRGFTGNRGLRRHYFKLLTSLSYMGRVRRARTADAVARQFEQQRMGVQRARFYLRRPLLYFMASVFQKMLLFGFGLLLALTVDRPWQCLLPVGASLLPTVLWLLFVYTLLLNLLRGRLYRLISDPAYAWNKATAFIRYGWRMVWLPEFRRTWLVATIELGASRGMLTRAERNLVLQQVDEPTIERYLRGTAVHLALLPVTRITAITVGLLMARSTLAEGGDWGTALTWFLAIQLGFQLIPISPGSICRGTYVLWLMFRDRSFRDYLIAAPMSFIKTIGYAAFPVQMSSRYPTLSRFLVGLNATRATRWLPVFGERGALLEHFVFDLFINVPLFLERHLRRS